MTFRLWEAALSRLSLEQQFHLVYLVREKVGLAPGLAIQNISENKNPPVDSFILLFILLLTKNLFVDSFNWSSIFHEGNK